MRLEGLTINNAIYTTLTLVVALALSRSIQPITANAEEGGGRNVVSNLYWILSPQEIAHVVKANDGQTLHFNGGVIFTKEFGTMAVNLSAPQGGKLSNCTLFEQPILCDELVKGVEVPFDAGLSAEVELSGDFTTGYNYENYSVNELIIHGKNEATNKDASSTITAHASEPIYLPVVIK